MAKVTGIGGIFFKTTDCQATLAWYQEKLGIAGEPWGGSVLHWRHLDDAEERGYTVWSPFALDADKFDPSEQPFMVNYRVDDLVGMLDAMKAAGVEVVGDLEEHPNGKFAWVLDPEGRKIELWEPVPSAADPYL